MARLQKAHLVAVAVAASATAYFYIMAPTFIGVFI